ncbi:ABC transporter substrate-binding protein [Pseudonocardia nigra]|uniref:ABC transporter substrate-binding protein n=1 Tax=Pseudonocardia nigra TaxID=1921578 RepID=UPI001C5FE94B|nr:sugar ABC transporter substrate-binding protein [Pseudonocardia nigra]
MARKGLMAALTGLALVATACGGGSGDSGEGGRIELSYALWNQDQAPVMEQLATEYERSHPNVDVSIQVTPFGEYFTKLQTAIGGDGGPDVFWLNAPNLALYASNEAVLPVTERVDSDAVDLSVYPRPLVDLYEWEGTQYALPRDYDTIGLWYNTELFDAAGVAYPDADWTWDDLRAAARKLTDPANGVYGITAWLTDQQGYYNTIAQAGGYVVSPDGTQSGYDDPRTIEGLRFWTDLIQEGVSPTHQQMIDTEPKQMFQSGKSAMFYGGSWQAVSFQKTEAIADKIDVAPLPAGVEDTSIIHGLGNAINANTAHPDEAWEFVKFLGSQQAAEVMAESGIVIPAHQNTQQAWLEAFPEYNLQIFLDAVAGATPYPVSANTAEWQALEKQMLPAAWTGQRPVDEVARELAAAMDRVLAEDD